MMWPFKKKTLDADQLPIDGPWLVAEGNHNGAVMFVRTNEGYREFKHISGYEHQVGIAMPLKSPEPNGLPGSHEMELLSNVEDILCSSLEEQAKSLFVAVISTGGMREFVFYTREPGSVEKRVAELRRQITSHEIQLVIQPDKDWKVYAQLA